LLILERGGGFGSRLSGSLISNGTFYLSSFFSFLLPFFGFEMKLSVWSSKPKNWSMKNQKENLTYNLDLILLKSKNLATFV
jgi:hypothetical protein